MKDAHIILLDLIMVIGHNMIVDIPGTMHLKDLHIKIVVKMTVVDMAENVSCAPEIIIPIPDIVMIIRDAMIIDRIMKIVRLH
jgi:hypothetical protein